jgi:hypothetical protein
MINEAPIALREKLRISNNAIANHQLDYALEVLWPIIQELKSAGKYVIDVRLEPDGYKWNTCCETMGKERLDALEAALAKLDTLEKEE